MDLLLLEDLGEGEGGGDTDGGVWGEVGGEGGDFTGELGGELGGETCVEGPETVALGVSVSCRLTNKVGRKRAMGVTLVLARVTLEVEVAWVVQAMGRRSWPRKNSSCVNAICPL